jgi:hypothetical protein
MLLLSLWLFPVSRRNAMRITDAVGTICALAR